MLKRQAAKDALREQQKKLAESAKQFAGFTPAREILKSVSAVPTIFAQFDHAVRVGGFPIERFSLVHGPSGHGKTTFMLGLMRSFLQRGHFVYFIDSELTTPKDWVETMLGEYAQSNFFSVLYPEFYEDAVAGVSNFGGIVETARASKRVSQDTSGIIILDSIKKLNPKGHMKKILKEGVDGGSVDGAGGRGAQQKAALNSQWLNTLIPMLANKRLAMVAVERESEDPNADMWARKFGNDYKVGGGRSLYYDASLVMRVERAKWVTDGKSKEEDGQKAAVFGERHRITIRKTKIAGKDDRQTVAHFHTSNGNLIPEGFDIARDVLEMAKTFDIVKGAGWLTWRKHKWNGEHNAVKKLTENPELLLELEAEVRAKFAVIKPVEITEDGEIVP